jgi:hypothetical protein
MVGGKIRSANVNGMHIEHNLHGGRTTMTEHNGVRVVTNGRGGYVQRPFRTVGGHSYYSRTYYDHGVYRTGVYRQYFYGGHYYYGYHSAYFFHPGFYGWAYQPWGVNVYWGPAAWGWVGAPWYGYYGFAPYPYYAGPSFWLTDYLFAVSLQASYPAPPVEGDVQGGIAVPANQPWTDSGTPVVQGQSYTITASGVANYGPGNVTPAGIGPGGCQPNPVAPGLSCQSLVGKIGPAGIPFYVGPERTFVAPVSGELYLSMNDNYFADNSGAWQVSISQPGAVDAGPAPQGTDPVVLSQEVKEAIAQEVKAEIEAERAAAAGNSPAPVQDVPAALDPAHRTFMVNSDMAVTADGQECSLTQGDVLIRLTDTPDADQKVNVSIASSKKRDCAVGKTVAVAVDDLQEMHNHMAEQMDEGMKVLASKQGTGGMPKSPDAGTVASDVPPPAPDKSAASTLQAQQSAADSNESQIQREAGGSGGGSY